MSNNSRDDRDVRKTVESIEKATIETIDTIESVAIDAVKATAETMTGIVQAVAESIPPPRRTGVDQSVLNDIEIHVDGGEAQPWKELIQVHGADEELEELELDGKVEKSSGKDTNNALPPKYSPVKIAVRASALQAAKEHAAQHMSREVGGILLGDFHINAKGDRWALITGIVRAKKARQMRASLNFTPEAWADVWRLIDEDDEYGPDDTPWNIVGWYHTHPNFGIFFSGADHTVHDPHFTHPCHVALVIDPCQKQHGFFSKANEHSPAERCNEEKQCLVLEDDALAKGWRRRTKHKLTLPKVEIPSGDEDYPIEDSAEARSYLTEAEEETAEIVIPSSLLSEEETAEIVIPPVLDLSSSAESLEDETDEVVISTSTDDSSNVDLEDETDEVAISPEIDIENIEEETEEVAPAKSAKPSPKDDSDDDTEEINI